MKTFLLIAFLCIAIITLRAQDKNTISIGIIDSVNSTILKEQRKIWVYVPNNQGNAIYGGARYPVVYLLDGDGHFSSVVGMIQQLSSVNGNTICPQMIVVGIPNTDRTRDLTPTHVAGGLYMDSAATKTSGGGEAFMAFIEKELIPHIDSLYPTTPYRMLIGHSFGGLTVINTLVHHTNLFRSYIAVDPSMWWDNQKLLKQTEEYLRTNSFAGTAIYMGIANTMDEGMDTTRVQSDTSGSTAHIRSILKLSHYFAANKQNNLRVNYRYYNEDNHGSSPLITEYDGLHFIFKNYPLKIKNSYFTDQSFKIDSFLTVHYKLISAEFGYSVLPPEQDVNEMAYQFMGNKMFDKAESLFKLNIANYPESFNVYDSIGDLYSAKGDKAQAIENYKKALSIKETPDTRKKLGELQGK